KRLCAAIASMLIWIPLVNAQTQPPFPGGLPACVKNLNTCNSGLSTCSSDLGMCTTNLTACSNDLGACTTNLGSCTTNLSTCTADRTQLQTSLATCNASLTQTQANLATCTNSLHQAQASQTLAYRYTGSEQTFTVPPGARSIVFESWGAGGGAGGASLVG